MCRVKENGKGVGKLPELIPNSSGQNAINGNKVTGIVDSNGHEWTKVDSGSLPTPLPFSLTRHNARQLLL